jgi:NAD(P)-dependent dehydrogenase (short-subunit alcohol dehydrogenase family)
MGVLDGRSIVITGASRGLGEEMAVGFARQGARAVLAARSVDDLERVAQRCREAGAAGVRVVPTDITDEAQVFNLVDRAIETNGRIDTFVANAGTSYSNLTDKRYRELFTYDLDIVEQIFRVNTIGSWLCLKAALPKMEKGSSFIFIGSETARIAYPGAGVYALAKGTIDVMTSIASKEVAEQGIRVNCLSPGGMVDTHLFGPNKMPDFLKQHGYLTPDVMTSSAVWLASDDSSDINGCFIVAKEFNERGAEAIKGELMSKTVKAGARAR